MRPKISKVPLDKIDALRSAVSFRASYPSARRAANQSARPRLADASDRHCRGAPCGRLRILGPGDADQRVAEGSPPTRFAAGGNRIRTIGPRRERDGRGEAPRPTIVASRDDLGLMTPSSLSVRHLPSATAEGPFANSGTDGSNPVPSSGESANFRFRLRFHACRYGCKHKQQSDRDDIPGLGSALSR